jgi:hypothetical protein
MFFFGKKNQKTSVSSRWMMSLDWLLVRLVCMRVRNSTLALRRGDVLVLLFGGGALLAGGVGHALLELRAHASILAAWHGLWRVAAPLVLAGLGCVAGAILAGRLRALASAPFLIVLPLADGARRRAVALASLAFGFVMACCAGLLLGFVAGWLGLPDWLALGCLGWASWIAGAAIGLVGAMAAPLPERRVTAAGSRRLAIRIPWIGRLDGGRPAWLGSWACGLTAGRLPASGLPVIGGLTCGMIIIMASGASLGRHDAVPAVIGGVMAGLAVFMMSLRCRPLDSPVLRTAPLRFVAAWWGVLRLPLALSFMFFALPAGVALAAVPADWAMPVGGGASLLALDGSYAVFAAYFSASPLLAAISFAAILSYAVYKWPLYHDVVLACLAALLIWLWRRAAGRFSDG